MSRDDVQSGCRTRISVLVVALAACSGDGSGADAGWGPSVDAEVPDAEVDWDAAWDAGRDDARDSGGHAATDSGMSFPPDAAADADASSPSDRVYAERDGLVAIEAEHFVEADDNDTPRTWALTTEASTPDLEPDPDPAHVEGASRGAYLEVLPDTRVTHDDPLRSGENFFPEGGDGPIVRYRVHFSTPGTYYVWVRAYHTGTEDNGVHFGIDGEWPSSSSRIQWCNRDRWHWSNAQRDSGGSACGVPGTVTLEVDAAGMHTIAVSAREDGFELDKFLLTTDPDYVPEGTGPAEAPYSP